ncbi:MAG: alpha/beta hydrolase-fold protein [Planctomyces sp.]
MTEVILHRCISGAQIRNSFIVVFCFFCVLSAHAAKAEDDVRTEISASDRRSIESQLSDFRLNIDRAGLRTPASDGRSVTDDRCDILLFEKAAEWILRHNEFYKREYVQWTLDALKIGEERLQQKSQQQTPWIGRPGRTVLGYRSRVDGSVQPYAVTLPTDFDVTSAKRWPLHVELHGRNGILNEVSFIHSHEGNRSGEPVNDWIQLDVFGRTNNAYRWAGETDVLEAMSDLARRFPLDDRRIVLRGFSMGGAGAWHMGLHYPSLWCSVGAGAGFCDTENHLSLTAPLSPLHQRLVRIYDAQEYALNAFNVPTIGYGGELDRQLFASGRMTERAAQEGVTIRRLIGPKTEHKWHPESRREFMAFHAEHVRDGRPDSETRHHIRFVTYTPRYGLCDWIRIEEQLVPLERSLVDAEFDLQSSTLTLKTENVRALSVLHSDVSAIQIDGMSIQTRPVESTPSSTSGQNPGFESGGDPGSGLSLELTDSGWTQTSATTDSEPATSSRLLKRGGLQGPIDDAFMEPFLCVRGTGTPWNVHHQSWCNWTLSRFEREFDRWMRGRIRIVNDSEVTPEMMESHQLVLFGDPGSNSVIASVVNSLPIQWTKTSVSFDQTQNSSDNHGVAMVYPNPKNPNRYVVINSGHTFHDAEFEASNANLYPRLGDIAIIRFQEDGADFTEQTVSADIFDSQWQLPAK